MALRPRNFQPIGEYAGRSVPTSQADAYFPDEVSPREHPRKDAQKKLPLHAFHFFPSKAYKLGLVGIGRNYPKF